MDAITPTPPSKCNMSACSEGCAPINFMLLAGNHTLLNQSAWEDGILDKSLENGVGCVVGGAFNSGVLATGAVDGAKFCYEDADEEILEKTRRIEAVCSEFSVPLAAAALQFPLGHPAVTTVIPGCKSKDEVVSSVDTMNVSIPPQLWQRLKDEGLLPQNVPTPKANEAR